MIELGKMQKLYVTKKTDFGVYLNDDPEKEKGSVLLPRKKVPADCQLGDEIKVFIYKDSEDRLIATTDVPYLGLGDVAVLKVVSVNAIGAFMDMGLEKDVLLPFKEQTRRVHTDKSYLVSLYIDKSARLCVTMRVYDLLKIGSEYEKDDKVTGIIYDIKPEYGAFVAVDNIYHGLVPNKELHKYLNVGDTIEARVIDVREDGKLNLSLREKAYIQMNEDSDKVMELIENYDGELPFNDKCDPEIIKKELGLSKNAFKRAVGKLLKEGKIKIIENGILKL